MIRQNPTPMSVQLSRGTPKPTSQAPDEPTSTTTKHRCSCPESLQNRSPRAPVKPTSRKIYTPVKRSKTASWKHAPVKPMLIESYNTGTKSEQQKTLTQEKNHSPVEPTPMSTSVGLTGALKNSVQKCFSARVLPRTRRSCGQIMSKSHQNLQA